VILAGASRAQGNVVTSQRRCGGADQNQHAQHQTLVIAQRGNHRSNAGFQIAVHDHARGDPFLYPLKKGPALAANVAGTLQRLTHGVFINVGTEDAGQRVVRHGSFFFLYGTTQLRLDVRVPVTGWLGDQAGSTQFKVALPGVFTNLQQLRVDNLARGQKDSQQQDDNGRQ